MMRLQKRNDEDCKIAKLGTMNTAKLGDRNDKCRKIAKAIEWKSWNHGTKRFFGETEQNEKEPW